MFIYKMKLKSTLISDRYQTHKYLKRFFPDEERLLFSVSESDLVHVKSEIFSRRFIDSHQEIDFDEILFEDLRVNTPMSFNLTCNPTVKKNGKRYGLGTQESVEWLNRKTSDYGFELVGSQVEYSRMVHFRKPNHHIKLLSVQFQGVLIIKNKIDFWVGMRKGIGSAKGFGFGLLLVDLSCSRRYLHGCPP